MLVIDMVVMVSVVILMVVIVMVVEMMIEKWGLMECMQHEKFASFSSSILYMVTLR